MPVKRGPTNRGKGNARKSGPVPVAWRPRRRSPRTGELEDNIVDMALNGELAAAAEEDIRKQLAMGLGITFLRGTEIIKQYADGREELLGTVPKSEYKFPPNVPIFGSKKTSTAKKRRARRKKQK